MLTPLTFRSALTAILLTALTLTGCASNDTDKAPSTTSSQAPDDAPAPEEETPAETPDAEETPAPELDTLDFRVVPFFEGCDAFADLDTTELLGQPATPVFEMDDDGLGMQCGFYPHKNKPGPKLTLWIEMAEELPPIDDVMEGQNYAHPTELPVTAPWKYGFLTVYLWANVSPFQASGSIYFATSDADGMFNVMCRYTGEPQPEAEDDSYLLDEVAPVAEAAQDFCTRALERTIAP